MKIQVWLARSIERERVRQILEVSCRKQLEEGRISFVFVGDTDQPDPPGILVCKKDSLVALKAEKEAEGALVKGGAAAQ